MLEVEEAWTKDSGRRKEAPVRECLGAVRVGDQAAQELCSITT